jgi:hypothetical protein
MEQANLAQSSKDGCGPKRTVLPAMIIMMIIIIDNSSGSSSISNCGKVKQRQNYVCAQIFKHYIMKTYAGVEVKLCHFWPRY